MLTAPRKVDPIIAATPKPTDSFRRLTRSYASRLRDALRPGTRTTLDLCRRDSAEDSPFWCVIVLDRRTDHEKPVLCCGDGLTGSSRRGGDRGRGAAVSQQAIRYIVATGPGGASDLIGRTIAPPLSELLGVQIVVDNRAGAGNTVGAEIAARAVPDA
jgi:hypothetical protein